jgi:hypothetical protein
MGSRLGDRNFSGPGRLSFLGRNTPRLPSAPGGSGRFLPEGQNLPLITKAAGFAPFLPSHLCAAGTQPAVASMLQFDSGREAWRQSRFGKIGEVSANYLSLHDVYFVQRQVEPEKKAAKNLLVRLGSEWHGPDFMRINTRHIVRLEPVAPDSRMAQLIREVKKGPAAATPAPPAAAAPPGTPHKGEKKTPGAKK